MSNNSSLGIESIRNISMDSVNSSKYTGLNASQVQDDMAQQFLGNMVGSVEMGGVLFLTVFGFFMFKSEMGMDTKIGITVPLVYFIASNGWIPFAQGIIILEIIVVAALAGFRILKWADN